MKNQVTINALIGIENAEDVFLRKCLGGGYSLKKIIKIKSIALHFLLGFDLALILKSSITLLFCFQYFLHIESQANYFFFTSQPLQWDVILELWFLRLGANRNDFLEWSFLQ